MKSVELNCDCREQLAWLKTLEKSIPLYDKLLIENNVPTIRRFLLNIDYNQKHGYETWIDTGNAHTACNNIQRLLKECLELVTSTFPEIPTFGKNSVRTAEQPPFITRTNDPAVIERINRLLIKIGGWENAKFLLENLRLNDDFKE